MIERRDAGLHLARPVPRPLDRERKQRAAPIEVQRALVLQVENALGVVRHGPFQRRARIRRRRAAALLVHVLAETRHDEVVEALQTREPAHRRGRCSSTSRADSGLPVRRTAPRASAADRDARSQRWCVMTPSPGISEVASVGPRTRAASTPRRQRLKNELVIDGSTDREAILADLHETVAAVEPLCAEVLGPHADISGE